MSLVAPITPGSRVSFEVSDLPDPVSGTVTRVYTDAIGSEVAEISRPDGSTFLQCTRFLTAARRRFPDMSDVSTYPHYVSVFGSGDGAADFVTAWLEQGCAIDSRCVNGLWQHSFIGPKGAAL